MPTPKPVFVLGWGRSGTTWVSNLLLEHSKVVGIQHDRGIHEAGYFGVVDRRYGDIGNPVNYTEFANVMAASYLFRAAGADVAFLYSLFPASYAEVFRAAMHRFANEHGAECWVEKTPLHTLHGEALAAEYPDARFIVIERTVEGVLASRLGLFDRAAILREGKPHGMLKRWTWIVMWVLLWHHYRKVARALAREHPDRTLELRFEAVKADTEAVCRRMCEFLRLDFEPDMVETVRPANTSFDKDEEVTRRSVLSGLDRAWLKAWSALFGLIPGAVLGFAYRWGTRLVPQKWKTLPYFFFRDLPDAPEALASQLQGPDVRVLGSSGKTP